MMNPTIPSDLLTLNDALETSLLNIDTSNQQREDEQ